MNWIWSKASGIAVPVVAPTAVPTIMKMRTSGASKRSRRPSPMNNSSSFGCQCRDIIRSECVSLLDISVEDIASTFSLLSRFMESPAPSAARVVAAELEAFDLIAIVYIARYFE